MTGQASADSQAVIARLLNRIADLTLQVAVLEAEREARDVPTSGVPE